MNRLTSGIILPALLCLSALSAGGQSSILVTHFGKQDYNAGNQNWSVASDAKGYIYAGNNDGLLIFNGTDWSLHSSPDQTIVRSVYALDDGKVYTGSYEECGYWEKAGNGELKYFSLKPLMKHLGLHNDEIWKIVAFNGKLYFQSFTSLFVYDQKSIRSIPVPGTIIFLLKARNHLYLQSVTGMLYTLVGDHLDPLGRPGSLLHSEVKAILPMPDSTLLICTTSQGFFRFDGRNMEPWDVPAGPVMKECQINNALVAGNRLVVGTIVEGIFILDFQGRILSHLNSENYLQNNTVLSLCTDPNGNIWAGLDSGIDRISLDHGVTIYREKLEQPGAVYTAALFGSRLYIGTNRGVFTYDSDPLTSRFIYRGFLGNSQGQVWDLSIIDGQLLCGHTNGTYRISGTKMEKISPLSGGYIFRKLASGEEERLIQGTYSPLVVFGKTGGKWTYRLQVSGYQEPSRFIETDHLGNLWIGQAVKGLYRVRLSPGSDSVVSLASFGKKDGLPSDFNLHVFRIENRVVFTTGKQLYTWDDLAGKMIPYAALNSRLGGFEASTQITPIPGNRYWFIRHDDIALFRIREGEVRMLIHIYLPSYGIRMMEGYENIIQIDGNRSLACLDNGFAIFDLDRLLSMPAPGSRLEITDMYCLDSKGNRKRIMPGVGIILLPHTWNSILFRFTYSGSNNIRNQYQFRLAKIDSGWSALSGNASVEYTRLPKGEYTFMVRSLNEKGMFSEPLSVHFRIFPAWYESTVAWVLYALLFIAAFLLSTYFFRRRFTRRQEQLRRTAELKALDEQQRSEQQIIRLQNEKLQGEILHKTMQLADSTMSLIRKNELLIEIRRELDQHRKILGSQYPAHLFEKIQNLISRNISNDQDWKIFEELFDQAHQDFFKRLKTAYPDLTQSDLKLCAYLRLNLSSKEIAPLLNISFRGVETRRYRLRRRLELSTDSNLVDFIMQF